MRAPPVYCRLTVLTPGSRADVALPVDVPVAELVPMLMELLGEQGGPARPVPWRLTGPTGGGPRRAPRWTSSAFSTASCCGSARRPRLRRRPVFDDPVDALAALTAPPAEARRPGPAA